MSLSPDTIILIAGGLGLLLLLVGLVSSFIGRRSVVDERLGRYSESGGMITARVAEAEDDDDRTGPIREFLSRLGEGTDRYATISQNLARADIKLRPGEYLAAVVLCAAVAALLGGVLGGSLLLGVVFGVVGAILPSLYVRRAKTARLKAFNNQLSDMLNLMVNGLRAGYSTLMAMEAVSKELAPPIADEFRRVVQEIQLGIHLEEALEHLIRRIDSDDLDMVITAINVQREVGGNLAEIFEGISHTIRERVRIRGEIQALTAMGRATAWVISLMPVALVGTLFLINREYMMQFFNPGTRGCGIPMLVCTSIMVIAGVTIVQRIVNIDI
jgi:tight adherence protein B